MGFFGNKRKKIVITGTVCQVCGMSFTATDRLARHMTKAHGKAKGILEQAAQIVEFSHKKQSKNVPKQAFLNRKTAKNK